MACDVTMICMRPSDRSVTTETIEDERVRVLASKFR